MKRVQHYAGQAFGMLGMFVMIDLALWNDKSVTLQLVFNMFR